MKDVDGIIFYNTSDNVFTQEELWENEAVL